MRDHSTVLSALQLTPGIGLSAASRRFAVALLAAVALGLAQPARAAETAIDEDAADGALAQAADTGAGSADTAQSPGAPADATGAADSAETDTVVPQPRGIEEITVTAERREQSSQDVGASISVFSSDELERKLIEDVHDLALSVPSLQITGGLPALTLRGIGTDPALTGPALDPGFALHVNGTFAAVTATALIDFLDLERVEVLHGPQGTLFGRNTTGGTLNLITKKPSEELELSGDIEYSSFDHTRVRAILNTPIVQNRLFARLAVTRDWTGKPFQVEGGGRRQRLAQNALDGGLGARGSLRWLPSEELTIDLIASWAGDDSNGGGIAYLGDYPAFPAGRSPLLGGGPDYTGATPNPSDPFRQRSNRRQSQRWEAALAQGIVSWQVGAFELTSTSSYQYFDYEIDRDQDSSDIDAERLELLTNTDQLTQELILQWTPPDAGFELLLGANYDLVRNRETSLPIIDFQANADAANFLILDAFTFAQVSIFQPLSGPLFDIEADNRTEAVGVFANLWYDVTEKLRVSGGVRYSWTERDFNDESVFDIYLTPLEICTAAFDVTDPGTCAFILAGILGPVDQSTLAFHLPLRGALDTTTGNLSELDKEDSWNSVTWNAKVEYKVLPESMVYASVSTGERAGGFNFFGGIFGETVAFDSEEILAYEIGSKNFFFDRRLQLNFAAYYYDYDDRFIQETLNNITINVNAPSAEVVGADLTFVAAPFDNLRLNGSVGWLQAELDDDLFSQDNSVGPDCPNGDCSRPPQNLNGNRLPRSPEWTMSLGAEYALELSMGTLTWRIDHFYRDEVNFRAFENRLDVQSSYHRTDTKLRFDSAEGGWWIESYVQNLQDEDEIKTQLESANTHRQWWLAPPRTFGVRVGWRY